MKEVFTAELMEKAKSVKSATELITLATENGTEITPEEAANYFTKLNPPSESIADEELENVAGGGCGTTIEGYNCRDWACKYCFNPWDGVTHKDGVCEGRVRIVHGCADCRYKYLYNGGVGCDHPSRRPFIPGE